MKRKIWIDCDPGIDDAVMLGVFGASLEEFEILGISTVAGNQTVERTTKNALQLTSLLGMKEIPVYRGAAEPLVRAPITAGDVHGATGLGKAVLPETDKTPEPERAVPAMRSFLLSLPEGEKITLVLVGALTNAALLFKLFPEVKEKIERMVIMGGADQESNIGNAEFNIYVDPEAARIVFASGLPITMCGLDVTLKCGVSGSRCRALLKDDHPMCRAYGEMLCSYGDASSGTARTATHDATTVLWLLHPELFGGEQAAVTVDCDWGENRGRTVCERIESGPVLLLDRVDADRYEQILLEKLHQTPRW